MVDVLVLSPHPDDAEIGCGGSMLLAIGQGLSVAVADLTEGECATRGNADARKREKEKAARLLGLCDRISLHFPDTRIGMDDVQRLALIALIRKMEPRIVLAPYREDRHPDHEAAGRLAAEACFYAGVPAVGEGPPHRPEQLYFYMIHTPFSPSFVMNISDQWEKKMAVLNAYRTQFHHEAGDENPTPLSNPDFLRSHRARCRHYGAMIGVSHGEPFYSSGPLPTVEFPSLGRVGDTGAPGYRSY